MTRQPRSDALTTRLPWPLGIVGKDIPVHYYRWADCVKKGITRHAPKAFAAACNRFEDISLEKTQCPAMHEIVARNYQYNPAFRKLWGAPP
ncbi:hypothetical protein TNCV_3139491 [Trichonephila clavipes]|nr:hypothetical protein TNCV_3139491 [Trichonephila clavipes]